MGGSSSKSKEAQKALSNCIVQIDGLTLQTVEESSFLAVLNGLSVSLKDIIPHYGYSSDQYGSQVDSYIKYCQYGFRVNELLALFKLGFYQCVHLIINRTLINTNELTKCLSNVPFKAYMMSNYRSISSNFKSNSYCSPISTQIINLINHNHVLEALLNHCIAANDLDNFILIYLHYFEITNGKVGSYGSGSINYMANKILKPSASDPKLHPFMIKILEIDGFSLFKEGSPTCVYGDGNINMYNSQYSYIWNWYFTHMEKIVREKDQNHTNLVIGVIFLNTYSDDQAVVFAKKAHSTNHSYISKELDRMLFMFDGGNWERKSVLFECSKYYELFDYIFTRFWTSASFETKKNWLGHMLKDKILLRMCKSDHYDHSLELICQFVRQLLAQSYVKSTEVYLDLLQYSARNEKRNKLKIFSDAKIFDHDSWLRIYRDNFSVQPYIESLMDLDSELFLKNKRQRQIECQMQQEWQRKRQAQLRQKQEGEPGQIEQKQQEGEREPGQMDS